VQPTYHLVWPPRRERAVCSPHTALFKLSYPPCRSGGFFSPTARTRRRGIYTPPRLSWIISPRMGGISTMGQRDGYHAAPISFHLTPHDGGFFFFAAQTTGRRDTHTPPRSTFQTSARRCASHTPSRLAFQKGTSGVQPTHRSVRAFDPPSLFGGILSSTSNNEAA